MDKALKRRIVALILMFITSFATVSRTAGFDDIRTVQILLLLSSGMCLGVALSLSLQFRRTTAGERQ